jgi:enolase
VDDRIVSVRLRGILESRGRTTVEASVTLAGGTEKTGSAPVAIARGRRERGGPGRWPLGPLQGTQADRLIREALQGSSFESQDSLDAALEAVGGETGLGADATLAVSLAFCRAVAAAQELPLYRHLARLAGTEPRMPRLLVNLFSGGIHDRGGPNGFQNVMLLPKFPSLSEDVHAAASVYDTVEAELSVGSGPLGQSASSGFVLRDEEPEAVVARAFRHVERAAFPLGAMALGIDVAAEHLRAGPSRYRLGHRLVDGEELEFLFDRLVDRFHVRFLEDPFDPGDIERWKSLTGRLAYRTCIAGDDLFATNADYVDPALANGIVLKLGQAGTVSRTLRTARRALEVGMTLCVSHRSGETEDTATCHLGVALGAAFIKVGGPRRGDRTAKYNELLRLAERLAEDASHAR